MSCAHQILKCYYENESAKEKEKLAAAAKAADDAARHPRRSQARSPLALGMTTHTVASDSEDDHDSDTLSTTSRVSVASKAGQPATPTGQSSSPRSPDTTPVTGSSAQSVGSTDLGRGPGMVETLVAKATALREAVLSFDKGVGHAANAVARAVPHVLAAKLRVVQPDESMAKQHAHTFARSRRIARTAYQRLVDVQSANAALLQHKDGERARDAIAVAMAAVDDANNCARNITPTPAFDCVPLQPQAQSLLVALAGNALVEEYVR